MSSGQSGVSFPFTISSDVPLGAQLSACSLETGADVIVREGIVPKKIEASIKGVAYQLRKGEALITIPDGSRLHVTNGSQITYQRGPQTGDRDIVLFILGTAWGALCYQRGLIPIHASGNIVNGQVVAFTGNSGAGKSTLAANLARRGYPFFSDDTLIFDPALENADGSGKAMCFAGQKQLKLWGDAIAATGTQALDPVRDFAAIDKHYTLPPEPSETRLAPLGKPFCPGARARRCGRGQPAREADRGCGAARDPAQSLSRAFRRSPAGPRTAVSRTKGVARSD